MQESQAPQRAGAMSYKPWRLLGFGFYQAWVLIAVLSDTLFPQTDFFMSNIGVIRCYFSLSVAVCLLVLLFFGKKMEGLACQRILLPVAAFLTATGTLLISYPFVPEGILFATTVTGITLSGMGNALIILAWGMLWNKTDVDRMGLHIAVSNAFAGCLYLVVVLLPNNFASVIAATLPLCSVIMLLSCEDEPRRQQEPVRSQPKSLMWKAIAAIAAIPLVFGAARALSSPAEFVDGAVQYRMVMGMTLFAVALAVVTALASRQNMAIRLYRFVTPLMVVGFAALAFVPEQLQWLPFAAIMCGFYSFEGLVWLLQPEYALRTRSSTISVFGWGRCLFHFSGFAGAAMGFWFVDLGIEQVGGVVCFAMIVVLVGLSGYVFTEHDLRRFIGSTAEQRAERQTDEAYGDLAREYGLSKRESEVFALLAKGRSVPFIADALFISKGTAKTHVRHVYEKLGVHSKQEMLSLLDEPCRE